MKRWRAQVSIRSLMLSMVIVGLSVGWFIDHSSQSRATRLQASELRRMERQFGRVTNALMRLQEVLSREGIELDYDLDRVRFSLETPASNKTKKRTINLFG